VNQQVNGGIWVLLGSFDMAPGQNHRVVLSDDANEYVIGDAIKFVLETNARAVVADAVKIVGENAPAGDFAATSSTVLREYVTLGGRPLALIEAGQIQYVHPDHLGTPQKMTDQNGALVWDAVYRPFGEAEQITGPASNPQRFPGQVYDPETGFHYNYFRDCAPGLGRYVESDPIGLRGGVNTYGYVGGNPKRYTDPHGLDRTYWWWWDNGRSIFDGPRNGNWGGKNWSGGTNPSWNDRGRGPLPPTDSADACYRDHDLCYEECCDEAECRRECDRELVQCLSDLPDNPEDWLYPPRPGTEGDSDSFRDWAIDWFQ
jgi:RHS repeat-associated protein